MKGVEFYADSEGGIYVLFPDGKTKAIRENDREIISDLLSMISDLKPQAYDKLLEFYSKFSRNKIYYEFRMAQRFVKCNFPHFDLAKKDIDTNGKFNAEKFYCPIRDECPLSGIVCNGKIESTLTEREKEIFALIADGAQSEEIAENLFLSVHTINRHRENIKIKIGARSVSEMVSWWYKNQLNEK